MHPHDTATQLCLPDIGPCWFPPQKPHKSGYVQVKANGVKTYANRLALATALGRPLAPKEMACHVCDHPACVRNDEPGIYIVNGVSYIRFGHLWLGDVRSNAADALAKGRLRLGDQHGLRQHPECVARGDAAGQSKLTSTQVMDIRAALACGVSQQRIAEQYGVSQRAIGFIHRRETWRHIP